MKKIVQIVQIVFVFTPLIVGVILSMKVFKKKKNISLIKYEEDPNWKILLDFETKNQKNWITLSFFDLKTHQVVAEFSFCATMSSSSDSSINWNPNVVSSFVEENLEEKKLLGENQEEEKN